MASETRRALFAAVSSIGLAAGSAVAGDFEKAPGVPPEVEIAKSACPTLTGPCHGYYATRWRVLPCPIDLLPGEGLPPIPRSPADRKPGDAGKDKSNPMRSAAPRPAPPAMNPVRIEYGTTAPARPRVVEVLPTGATRTNGLNPIPVPGADTSITIDGRKVGEHPSSVEADIAGDLPPVPHAAKKPDRN